MMTGDMPSRPRYEPVARAAVIAALEEAINVSRMRGTEADKLRAVGINATRLAVGTSCTEDGHAVGCPLVQAGLWDGLAPSRAHTFYRSWDRKMGPGFLVLEIVG